MSAHTPGKWEIVPQNDGSAMIARRFDTGQQINPTGLRIIANVLARRNSLPEDEANARLIANAPDLLAALQNLVERYPNNPGMVQARAAIAKATA